MKKTRDNNKTSLRTRSTSRTPLLCCFRFTGNQCASVSTDGQMMWWDTRRLGEPTDTLQLATDSKGGGMVLGGSSMEYNQEAGPTKYLVGTEQGIVLQVRCNNYTADICRQLESLACLMLLVLVQQRGLWYIRLLCTPRYVRCSFCCVDIYMRVQQLQQRLVRCKHETVSNCCRTIT